MPRPEHPRNPSVVDLQRLVLSQELMMRATVADLVRHERSISESDDEATAIEHGLAAVASLDRAVCALDALRATTLERLAGLLVPRPG